MASFADNIPQFTPYVSQLPVDLMTQVGVYKQQKYDQGVEKLQSYFDNVIGGMDIANEADRTYAQSLINKVGSNMKWLVGGDFSNQQLVNSVGNMATQITKDPNILNAVSSTAFYRQQRAKIQKDIDEGKTSPANIDEFDKAAAPWLNSKKVGQKFATAYNPFFDVDKFVKETFDAIKPGGYTHDQVFETDINGNPKRDAKGNLIYSPVMVRLKKEGRLPQEVEGAINQIMSDPRVTKQLGITGKYDLAGVDPQRLINIVYDQRDAKLADYNNKLAELNLDKKLGKDVQADIDALENNIKTIVSNYDELAKSANSNPDGLRGYLHTQQVKDNYRSIYGSTRTSIENMENPGWKANFELTKEANLNNRWLKDFQWKQNNAVAERAFHAQQNQLNRENQLAIALLKGKGKGVAGTGNFGALENMGGATYDENSSAYDPVMNFEVDKARLADDYLKKSYSFIWDAYYTGNPRADKNVADILAKNPSLGRDGAIKIVMDRMAKLDNKTPEQFINEVGEKAVNKINRNLTTASPALVDQYKAFKQSQQAYANINNRDKSYKDAVNAMNPGTDLDSIYNNLNTKPVTVFNNGKSYKLDKQDFLDAAIYMDGHTSAIGLDDRAKQEAAAAAERRLAARGKQFILDTALDQWGNSITGQHGLPTALIRTGRAIGRGIAQVFGNDVYAKDENNITLNPFNISSTSHTFKDNIAQAYNLIHNEKTAKALTDKAALIKAGSLFRPNLKADVLTGEAKEDRALYQQVTAIAGNYVNSGKNLAPKGDPANFLSAVTKKDPDAFDAHVSEGPDGQPMVTLVSYNSSGASGSLVIAPDEAIKLGIDVQGMYEPSHVVDVRQAIYANPNKRTSHGDPGSLDTYDSGDSYYQKWKLPKMQNAPKGMDAQANIEYNSSTGLYYATIYGSYNGKRGLMQMDGLPDLKATVKAIESIDPSFINSVIKNK
jgi:hypothetical protein